MLSDVVRRGLLGKFVEDILRQPRRKVFGHVTAVVWVGTGLLVRWATGKRLTNRLPKLSLITPSPPLNSGILDVRIGLYVPTPKFFTISGDPGE